MVQSVSRIDKLHKTFLSEDVMKKSERAIIAISIISFIIHLILIFLADLGMLGNLGESELLSSPISAIYTPFSFILFFEVYLLVFYLPKSITVYIGKQYEIITLIVIRRLFKDLSQLELSNDWFEIKYDLQFTYDIIAAIALFFLIYIFNKLNKINEERRLPREDHDEKLTRFISLKKLLGSILVPVFIIMALYSLGLWIFTSFFAPDHGIDNFRDVNKIFFDEFFTVLILTDVLLLLLSLFQTSKFSKVFRNSGFIISTILIRISFGTEGLINSILIVVAVLFGVLVLAIHNKFSKLEKN
ncbi:hypothetical protein HZR84_14245 [Hyphobacterium sp. CCMP332]|nr:hypothetical protein HZR84_14245 [Hyphobacterium sp. CCMP332]